MFLRYILFEVEARVPPPPRGYGRSPTQVVGLGQCCDPLWALCVIVYWGSHVFYPKFGYFYITGVFPITVSDGAIGVTFGSDW